MVSVTSVFTSFQQARRAVNELETQGIRSSAISILTKAPVDATQHSGLSASTGIGAAAGGTAGLLSALGLLAVPGVGPIAAAGWLASLLGGILAGGAAGGLLSLLVNLGLGEVEARSCSQALKNGGTLVSVRIDAVQAETVRDVLEEFGPVLSRVTKHRRGAAQSHARAAAPAAQQERLLPLAS